MLNETVLVQKRVGLLKKGFYYIKTTRAIWSRVEIISRSRHCVRILYTGIRRSRTPRGRWQTLRVWLTEDLPIHWIIETRRYSS